MVRLADLPDYEAEHLLAKDCPQLGPPVWTQAPSAKQRRVALVTTAGVHLRGEENFFLSDATYRVIPAGASPGDVVMSHASVNFDRTGFQEDLNVVLPLTRFEELASTGAIASVANFHYSFMGAGLEPAAYESTACQLAGLMKRDGVNTVFLTPV